MNLTVSNASFTYPRAKTPVFRDLALSVEDREILTILGPNGIGKSTLLKCIMGIYSLDKGTITVDGKEVSSAGSLPQVSYVPQAHGLSYSYTAKDFVVMGRYRQMGMLSITSKQDRERAEQAILEVGMQDYMDRPCNRMSGGQLQLIYIARALAADPELLILDEPESNLDFRNQMQILELIGRLVSERGISSVINTHYPEHALRISDKTLLMDRSGSVEGPTRDILTEENIRRVFHVDSNIGSLTYEGETVPTFTVLRSLEENDTEDKPE